MIRRKVCMVGAYAVGKTSLVRRFVQDSFSDRYRTTIGVKVLKKELTVDGHDVILLVWDMHGEDEFQSVRTTYLRGAAGLLLVADGTRADTVETAARLAERVRATLPDVPCVALLNKVDLDASLEIDLPALRDAVPAATASFATSAKTGAGVGEAFRELTLRMVGGDDGAAD